MLVLLIIVVVIVGLSPHYLGVDWGSVLQVYGTLFGVVIGSYLSGVYATDIVKREMDYNKELIRESKKETELKNVIIIKSNLAVLRREFRSIVFHAESLDRGHNGFENDPLESLVESFTKVTKSLDSLREINPEFITIYNLKLIYEIFTKFNDIERQYDAYLYDPEGSSDHLNGIKHVSEEIIKRIDNSSTSKLEDTE